MKQIRYLVRCALNKAASLLCRMKLFFLCRKLPSDGLVIDCGANRGDMTLNFARKGAEVHAFEPDPWAFSVLQKRIGAFSNVHLHPKAVGVNNGQMELFFHKDRSVAQPKEAYTVSSSLIKEKTNISQQSSTRVEVIDFLEFIRSFGRPIDIIKMDIEGAEVEILEKIIRERLDSKFGLLLAETHESKIPSHRQRVAALKSAIQSTGIENIRLNWL